MAPPSSKEYVPLTGRVCVILMQPYGDYGAELLERLHTMEKIQVVELDAPEDAIEVARRAGGAVIIGHALEPAYTNLYLRLLKHLELATREKKVRFLITLPASEQDSVQKLMMAGCSDTLIEPVQLKGLLFKLERLTAGLIPAAAVAKNSGEVKWVDPLTIKSDFWSSHRGGAKKVGDRWLIKLTGPNNRHGEWIRVEGTDSTENLWRFSPRDPQNDPYHKEDGSWFYKGRRPEYSGGLWAFVGKTPDLAFLYEGESFGAKLRLDTEGSLLVARDSVTALETARVLAEETDKLANAVQKRGASLAGAAGDILWTEPLMLQSDCWLIQARTPRRVNDRWAVTLLGPGPKTGRWAEVQGVAPGPNPSDKLYVWTPNGGESPFIVEEGFWYFRGTQPQPVEDEWLFTGERGELYFAHHGRTLGAKFLTNAGNQLVIAKDSNRARGYLPLLLASLDPVFKTQAPLDLATSVEWANAPVVVATEPKLTPAALAFLMSELMSKIGADPRDTVTRYCSYVSGSCGGIRCEMWVPQAGEWFCIGAHDGSQGKLKEQVMSEKYACRSSVNYGDREIGVLILGPEAEAVVSAEYLQAAARISSGLVNAFIL